MTHSDLVRHSRHFVTLVRDLVCSPAFRHAALLILPYAGLLVGLDIATRYGELTGALLPRDFMLSQDRSFGEYLEYALMIAMAVMLLRMWRRDGSPLYLVNAILFVILTLDNALEIHEAFGFWVAPILPQSLPIAAHHLGEPLMFAGIGTLWLAGLGLALRGARIDSVLNSLIIVGCIGATAMFGVAEDAVVSYGTHSDVMIEAEAFIEDAGEFAMIILAFLFTVAIYDAGRRRWRAEAGAGAGARETRADSPALMPVARTA
jgi:hypothetical protein